MNDLFKKMGFNMNAIQYVTVSSVKSLNIYEKVVNAAD